MKIYSIPLFCFICCFLFFGGVSKKTALLSGVAKVEVKKIGINYLLYKDGKPYYIKGAGGYSYLDDLNKHGGNSIRTWSDKNIKYILDEALKNGLTVMVGLEMGRERQGFNYNDRVEVEKQFNLIKATVLKYKDHPALLMWCIGNEVAFLAKNDKVWNAIEEIAKMIKKIDPNHPTTTTLAGVPSDQVKSIIYKCPDIDIISVNAFQDLPYVPIKLRQAGWQGPYIISEWGSTGYWEVKTTKWNAVIEETSTQKALVCKERYELAIKKDKERCLGAYVFYWGHKQERTHTFFGFFGENGEKTSMTDMLQFLWTSTWPINKSPDISFLSIDNKRSEENVFLLPSSIHKAVVLAKDPENQFLKYKWEIYRESNEYHKTGGDLETKPSKINQLILEQINNTADFTAPSKKGPYRLFVYVLDGSKNMATANFPFYVN